MISKAQIKLVKSLSQKKYRKKHGLFIAEGVKLASEFLNSEFNIHTFFATHNWMVENQDILSQKKSINFIEIEEKELNQISNLSTPNEVLLLTHIPTLPPIDSDSDHYLLLDNINDPGNLGTIIRIADWYGFKQVICSENCVDVYNPKVVQASMGSLCRINAYYLELENFISNNPHIKTYTTELEGKSIYNIKPELPAAFIIGNEANGIRNSILEKSNQSITIPKRGQAESLNAAVATAIVLDNFMRVH